MTERPPAAAGRGTGSQDQAGAQPANPADPRAVGDRDEVVGRLEDEIRWLRGCVGRLTVALIESSRVGAETAHRGQRAVRLPRPGEKQAPGA